MPSDLLAGVQTERPLLAWSGYNGAGGAFAQFVRDSTFMPRPTRQVKSLQLAGSTVPWRSLLSGAILVLLVLVVYQPALDNGFIWDDDMYVEENPTLRTLTGLRDIWFKFGAVPQYYPLVYSTFWIEYHLWGLWPAGYHAVNLSLHATSVLLLWRLLARLAVPGAWLAAALFAVHPVAVESVAWVTERKNVLSCALALAALLAYLRFSPPEPPADAKTAATASRMKWVFYGLALALYLGALLSKTVTASVPAVLLVIYWWKRGRITRRDVLQLAPFFAVGLALAGVTVWMEKAFVGATGPEWNLSPVERILIAGRALWFYAGKLVWPHPLAFFYPRWTIDAGVWWQYLYPAAALALIVTLWLARRRIGRGPLAAVLIFAGVLTPALGFFNVYPFLFSFVADHFQYHASMALLAAAAAALVLSARRFLPHSPWVVPLATVALLMPLTLWARSKTTTYHDLATLYEDTIAQNPTAWVAHLNLGYCLERAGNFKEAAAQYRKALVIHPTFAALHIRLGTALVLGGQTNEATAELDRALAGALSDSDRSVAHVHLGIILNSERRFDDAISHFWTALELIPDSSLARLHYGIALAGRGELAAGIEQVRDSLALNPNSAVARNRLGTMLFDAGRLDESLDPLRSAVNLQPANPVFRENLAAALAATGDLEAAESQLRQAIRLNPQSAVALDLLGRVFARRGAMTAAIAAFEAVLKVDPAFPGARDSLQKARDAESRRSSQ